jgi:hypothetical protein
MRTYLKDKPLSAGNYPSMLTDNFKIRLLADKFLTYLGISDFDILTLCLTDPKRHSCLSLLDTVLLRSDLLEVTLAYDPQASQSSGLSREQLNCACCSSKVKICACPRSTNNWSSLPNTKAGCCKAS